MLMKPATKNHLLEKILIFLNLGLAGELGISKTTLAPKLARRTHRTKKSCYTNG